MLKINLILKVIYNYNFSDPLEQFDIFRIFNYFNNFFLFLFCIIALFIIIIFFGSSRELYEKKYTIFSIINFQIFIFIWKIMESNILLSKYFLIQIYFIIFSFILFGNLIGLIPFSFTLTSSFILTLSIALITLIIINILAIYRHGFYQFSNFFLPNGTPLGIAFLLVFIEFVSYIARLFSLSIRLFANMMSGHTLLKILIGFCFTILFSLSIFSSFAALPWILILCIVILEILIAFLQAYVFLILICIYCNDILFVH